MSRRIRPSVLWYWVAGALITAGLAWLVGGFVYGFTSLARQVDEFQRVPLPGQGEVIFAEAGDYVLYYEAIDAVGGSIGVSVGTSSASDRIPSSFRARIVPTDERNTVPISDFEGSLTYTVGGHAGQALGSFRIENPGTYRLQTWLEDGEPATVALGPGLGSEITAIVLIPLGGAAILVPAGAGVAVVAGIERSRAKRQMNAWPGTVSPGYPDVQATPGPIQATYIPSDPGVPQFSTGGGFDLGDTATTGYPAASGSMPDTGRNGYAIASLVFGLVGSFPLAIGFGVVGLRQIRRGIGRGRGMAVAGLVLGAFELAVTVLIAAALL